jgi:HPt (histidine-containing phosphotransfer) domain-containing protein
MKFDIRIFRGFLALGLLCHDRVVSTYISLVPQYMNQVEQLALALKSSAANIGAIRLSGFCK